ncbi:receptor like protein 22-like [Gossypium hirsutum]|uniref:Receptor like protein 22-like n=1 Tax=Gossypium hirsutum TaxID=3635 RepID=A0ABM3A1P3_GOSHI|nr:receptor like protein 22-like [Gossypium hirsutum]
MAYMGVQDVNGSGGIYSYSIGIVMEGQDIALNKISVMKQFNTFGNASYEGNKGLHGFPLSSDCNNNELPPPSNSSEEGGSKSNVDFGWKIVLLGYGCGVVLGLGVGYVVFQTEILADPAFRSLNVSENQLHGQIFNTFGNNSYEGNRGINETPPPNVLEKDGSKANIVFGWKVVLIGYGCGVVFGMAMGCVFFQTGSHSCSSLIQFKNSFSINQTKAAYLSCDEIAGLKSYPKTNSWKEGTDCCSWDGVTCDHLNAHVIALDLSCSWLYGNFPSNTTLFLLPHLQKLNLAYNDFNLSKIPSEFGRFTSLFYLNLSNARFVGDKHALEGLVHNLTEVRHLFLDGVNMSSVNAHVFMNLSSSLRSLILAYCDLQGKFPKSIFDLPNLNLLDLGRNQNLNLDSLKFNRSSNLEHLDLSWVSFSTESIDSVDNLRALKYLGLSGNSFIQGLSVSITNLSSLEQLMILGAKFSGGLPDSMGNLVSLKFLVLSYSNLSGPVPRSLGNLLQLTHLDLSLNQLSGQIPRSLGNLLQLTHLDLSENQLSGQIPRSLGNLLQLTHLDLSENQLSGQIPRSLGNLLQLTHLYLVQNQLSGQIPRSLGNLLQLIHLRLSLNQLSGQIPRSLGNLLQLTYLDLSENQLSRKIPRSLGNLLQLTQLDLLQNQLSGQIPSSILNLTQLEYLRISENSLEGSIPDEYIDLSQNQLSGQIKEFQSKSLAYLYLNNNKLQGLLPSSIFQLLNLTGLRLSSNNLSGVIEFRMFSNLPNLEYLDLSYNNLSLTSNTTSTVNLRYLYLSSCNLSEFPQFLKGLKILERLNLSCNKIEGKIPQWMQEVGNDSLTYLNVSHNSLTEVEHFPWKNIEFLDLSSNLIRANLPIPASMINVFLISNNSFNGEVSSLICNASSLQILDLSHNYLSGTIPQCFGNLSNSLQFLNLRKNKFYGTIPPTFAEGCQLSNFNLNGNLLEGPLTPSILNCNGLEVLDLGNNKINDTFLHWLGSLPQLQVLVLKSNHMHGPLCVNSSKSSPFFSKIQIFDLSSNYFSGPLPVRYINSFKAIINLEKIGSTVSYMGVNDPGGGGFYTYSIGIVMKGGGGIGGIPKVIGKLNLLKGLNLSHNNLNGDIPTSIGNLTNLEWLDLSSNRLSGTIPNRLADLTSLSSFYVSENQLHGQIPQGKQFNTFGNESYEGNKGLCGFPVSKGCNMIEPPPPNVLEKDGSKSNITFGWKVVLIGYGCGVVFGMSVGYVVFQTGKPKWLVNLVENQQEKRRRRKSKKGNRSTRQRRI